MELSRTDFTVITKAAKALSMTAAEERVETFVARVLHLNAAQALDCFPTPDPLGLLSTTVAYLTQARESVLRIDCDLPTYVVYEDQIGNFWIAGSDTYFSNRSIPAALRARLMEHSKIKQYLSRLSAGHDLEVIAAAILKSLCNYGEATQGSGDQGVDAIGRMELMKMEPALYRGAVDKLGKDEAESMPGDHVFVLASSKAVIVAKSDTTRVINPAHIRELVGQWVIQRDDVGIWRKVGIRMLTPMQLILVTTYRLSDESVMLCRNLGVQVWGMPELIYLICKVAPTNVFLAGGGSFSPTNFRKWWQARNISRLTV